MAGKGEGKGLFRDAAATQVQEEPTAFPTRTTAFSGLGDRLRFRHPICIATLRASLLSLSLAPSVFSLFISRV